MSSKPRGSSSGGATNGGGETSSPAHYRIPNQSGYFPAGSEEVDALVKVNNATLYQAHPTHVNESDEPVPLASGIFSLHDPAAGTADDVALFGRCGETIFYVMCDDATAKTSNSEFMLMLPENCIVVDLTGCSDSDVLNVEGLLAARTKFHDEVVDASQSTQCKAAFPEHLPEDSVSRAMFRAASKVSQLTVSAGEFGASKIDDYGEKKKEKVTETREVKVGKVGIMLAKGTRKVSEKTCTLTDKVSEKISDALGGKVGRAAAIREGDSATKKKARSLLLASTLAYAEIGAGAAESYELMVKSAQSQATSFVAKKYGKEAAELARHTAGAAANFGRAALTAQRVVNVKKLVKSAGKQMVKETIKSSI